MTILCKDYFHLFIWKIWAKMIILKIHLKQNAVLSIKNCIISMFFVKSGMNTLMNSKRNNKYMQIRKVSRFNDIFVWFLLLMISSKHR